MKLKSNIGQVKARLQRLQAGLPEAAAAAVEPNYWLPRLERVTLATLRAQWALERNVQTRARYEHLTPLIVSTLHAEALGRAHHAFVLDLGLVDIGRGLDIEGAADYNLGSRTPTGRSKQYAVEGPNGKQWIQPAGSLQQEQNLQAARQAVLDWVRLEKNRDERDAGLTDEEIASRLEEILGISDRAVPRDRTAAMNEAAEHLAGAIQRWLDGEGESPPVKTDALPLPDLQPAVIHSWLVAVLLAWQAFFRSHFRQKVQTELNKLRRRIQTELI